MEKGGLSVSGHRFPIVILPGIERIPLAALCRPDVILSPAAPSVGFIRRDAGDLRIYFIANTGNSPLKLEANFRVEGTPPEWWDPHTGEVTPAPVIGRSRNGVAVSLELEPYGSRLLVFGDRPSRMTPAPARELPPPLDLAGGWDVIFEETGKHVRMDRLRSWSEYPDTRFYSGRAAYKRSFSCPAAFLTKDIRATLDLGEAAPVAPQPKARFQAWVDAPVRKAAVVCVNGKRAGAAWHPPYEVDVTGLLRAGENELKIIVGNLAVNQLAGEPLPDYKDLDARYGHKFDPQDLTNLQPVPSGLLGAVRLFARPSVRMIAP